MAERTCLTIPGLCCETETRMVSKALAGVAGVEGVDIDVLGRKAWVRHAPGVSGGTLLDALRPLDMGARLPDPEAAPGAEAFPRALVACGLLLALTFAEPWVPLARFAALPAIALGIPPIVRKAWIGLRQRVLDMNLLMTLAVAGALVIGEWSEAAAVVFLFSVAEWLEDQAMDRARNAIGAVMKLAPEVATLANGSIVPAVSVAVGTRLLVKPGERIALDARVVEGVSAVDEAALTGEALPADVALLSDDLGRLPEAIAIGRRALALVRLNVAIAIVTKALVMVLGLVGIANLWLAVAADMGTSLVVIGIGLSMLRFRLPASAGGPLH